jgi:hypothetical protein
MKNLDVVVYLCMDLELAVTRSFTLSAWWSERSSALACVDAHFCKCIDRCSFFQCGGPKLASSNDYRNETWNILIPTECTPKLDPDPLPVKTP